MSRFGALYYLYSISHPGKRGVPLLDLSDDGEAQIQVELPTDKQKASERVIMKTFFNHDILWIFLTKFGQRSCLNCGGWASACQNLVGISASKK